MDFKSCFTTKNISFLVFILFLIFCIIKMTDIALLIFASYVIACSINPLVDKLSNKLPRAVATILVILAVIVVMIGVFTPIVVMAIREIKEFITQLPQQVQNLEAHLNTLKIGSHSLSQFFNIDTELTSSSKIAQEVVDKSINFTMNLIGAITILVTVAIIVFFFSNDRDKIKEVTLKLFPSSMRYRASKVIDGLETKVGGYVSAQILCNTILGIVVAIGLGLLQVNYAIFLGFISAVLDLVPIVGPIITGVLILIIAFPKGVLICVLAIIVFLFAQFVQNNWAKPYFFSKYMELHPLIVIFSFVFAAKLLGVIGVILAPAIAAVLVTLFEEVYIKTMNDEL